MLKCFKIELHSYMQLWEEQIIIIIVVVVSA